MGKRLGAFIMILCLASGLWACAGQKEEEYKTEAEKKLETPSETEEKEYQKKLDAIEPSAYGNVSGLALEAGVSFAVIGQAEDGEYWEQVKEGAEQAAADINAELGFTGKDEVKVTYSGAADAGDVDEQVNILDEELARYPAGISISLTDAEACEVQFDLAAGNGIPVVVFDSGSDYQGLAAAVSTNNIETAKMAADKLAGLMEESGEILVFVQNSSSRSAKERESGFTEQLQSEHAQITAAGVYYMDELDEIRKEIAKEQGLEEDKEITEEDIPDEQVLDYIIEKHPNVKGYYATAGDVVMSVAGALERAEKEDTVLIGYDGDKEELELLEKGTVDGLIIQNPFGMGYAAVVASARAALSMGNEAYVNTGAMWVTKENLSSAEVEKWLY